MTQTARVTFLRDYPHHGADGERQFSVGTKTVPLSIALEAHARGFVAEKPKAIRPPAAPKTAKAKAPPNGKAAPRKSRAKPTA